MLHILKSKHTRTFEHSFFKSDIKTKISSTEQALINIKGLRNLYIKKVNFILGHPVCLNILVYLVSKI